MKKTIRLTESELVKLVQRIIKEDETMNPAMTGTGKKVYTLAQFGVKIPLLMTYLQGSTPFYINGVEQKKNVLIKPTDKLSCKSCTLTLLNQKTGVYYNVNFNADGVATFGKEG